MTDYSDTPRGNSGNAPRRSRHKKRVIVSRRYVRIGRLFWMRQLAGAPTWGRRRGVLAAYLNLGYFALGWEARRAG